MAFFGLTALGNQDPFQSMSKTSPIINIFSEKDIRNGFDKVDTGRKGTSVVSSPVQSSSLPSRVVLNFSH